jgi:hypothetical protein
MPNNSELKKALEKASKQIVLKNKQIEELNAKLSHFLHLEELNSQKVSIIDQNPVATKTEISEVSNAEVEVQTEIVSAQVDPVSSVDSKINDVNVEIVDIPADVVQAPPVKKRSRSIWRLYLW